MELLAVVVDKGLFSSYQHSFGSTDYAFLYRKPLTSNILHGNHAGILGKEGSQQHKLFVTKSDNMIFKWEMMITNECNM